VEWVTKNEFGTNNGKENQNKITIPRIEKPSIQIVIDNQIDRKLDYHVAAIAPQLHPLIEYELDPPTPNIHC